MTGESIGTALPDYDYATIKYDSDGRAQWIARYNGSAAGDDEATALRLMAPEMFMSLVQVLTRTMAAMITSQLGTIERALNNGSFAIKGPKIRMISPVESPLIVPITSMSLETVLHLGYRI